ncbi:hypothetical protein VUR80DRAFT_5316 [Thermomyces stellatus]
MSLQVARSGKVQLAAPKQLEPSSITAMQTHSGGRVSYYVGQKRRRNGQRDLDLTVTTVMPEAWSPRFPKQHDDVLRLLTRRREELRQSVYASHRQARMVKLFREET